MTFWLDAHLSPGIARWLRKEFRVQAFPLRDLGIHLEKDIKIWFSARQAQVIFITKDSDFAELLSRYGPPPKLLLLTCGNTSESNLRLRFEQHFKTACQLFERGEPLVEIQ